MSDQEKRDTTFDTPTPAPPDSSEVLPDEAYYQQPAPTGRPGHQARLGMALLLVGMIWLAVEVLGRGSFTGHPGSSRTPFVEQTLPGTRLEMDVGTADVEVRPWDGPGIRVEARYGGGSPEDYTVDVRQVGDTVRVTGAARPCVFCSRSLGFRVSAPDSVAMAIKTTQGDINIEGVNGAVSLSTSNGSVEARQLTQGITVNTTNGAISLDDIAGKLEVTTVNGEVQLEDGRVTGARVKTTNGSIELEGVAGELDLENVNGDITVRRAQDGRLRVSTSNGHVEYEGSLANGGTNTITSLNGDVELRLPEDSGFRLDASTVSGDLKTDFDLHNELSSPRALRGTAGSGAATLTIETTGGDVNVSQE